MTKLISVSKAMLIVLLSASLAMLFAKNSADAFVRQAESYPESAQTLTLHNVPMEKQQQTLDVLLGVAQSSDSLVVRVDNAVTQRGENEGVRLGIAGTPDAVSKTATFTFMGQELLDSQAVNELLTSKSASATLGLDVSAADMLHDLPSFVFGQKLVVMKLDRLVEESDTVNGTYRITGLTDAQLQHLTEELSRVSGVRAENMLHPRSGHTSEEALMTTILQVVCAATVILLFALCVVSDFYDARNLGIHLLCGWSRIEFALKTNLNGVLFSFVAVPLACGVGAYASNFTMLSWPYYSFMCLAGAMSVLCVMLVSVVVAVIVFSMRPVDAIRNRVSRKAYIAVLIVFYGLSVIFACLCGYALDGPMYEIRHNASVISKWRDVSNLCILRDISVGDDASSITGQSKTLARDFYRWYESMSTSDGVYLVNTTYFSQKILDGMRAEGAPFTVPSRPFRLYIASPNYLRSQGFDVDETLVAKAHAGERVYLLPTTMDQKLAEEIEAFVHDTDTSSLSDADIQTPFYQSREFVFETYTPEVALFNWETDTTLEQSSDDSVIFLCTPENMIFAESESLWASGLSNSYVKLTRDAADTYTSQQYFENFDLADNAPLFDSVSVFVAGIQKQLWQTLQMFGIAALFMAALMIVLAVGLTSAYQFVYKEMVGVKRLMGYPSVLIYRLPFAVVFIAFFIGATVMLVLRSNLGLVYLLIMLVSQVFVLHTYVRQTDAQYIHLMLKE